MGTPGLIVYFLEKNIESFMELNVWIALNVNFCITLMPQVHKMATPPY